MVQQIWKTVWWFLKKLKIELPYDPAIPLLDIYPEELKAESWKDIGTPTLRAALFINSQKVEAIQVSTDRWMDKQNVVYVYNGILFSLKQEENSGTCYNMDEPWGRYARWNEPVTKRQILYD